jgi:transposase InsO family protein
LRRAQNEFDLRIKKIRNDNGTEFKNSQIEGFLEEEGIKHEFSSPYTPQQNSVVERDGEERAVVDGGRWWEMLSACGDEFRAMVNYCP